MDLRKECATYHPKIKSETWPNIPLFGELLVGAATGNAFCGVAGAPGSVWAQPFCDWGVEIFSAFRRNADVDGARRIGVPTAGPLSSGAACG